MRPCENGCKQIASGVLGIELQPPFDARDARLVPAREGERRAKRDWALLGSISADHTTRLALQVRDHGRSGRKPAKSGHRFSNVCFQPQSGRQSERLLRSGPSHREAFRGL